MPKPCCLLFPRNTSFHLFVILSYVDGKASFPLTHKHSKYRITSVVGTRWIVSSIVRVEVDLSVAFKANLLMMRQVVDTWGRLLKAQLALTIG